MRYLVLHKHVMVCVVCVTKCDHQVLGKHLMICQICEALWILMCIEC